MFKRDLKWRMIIILGICWLVPIALASFLVFFTLDKRMSDQISKTVSSSANKAVSSIEMQLEECINASRNATYFQEIENNYLSYLNTGETQKLYDQMTIYLSEQYRFNRNIEATIVFFTENPELFYSTYSYDTTYDSILFFKEELLSEVMNLSESIDTHIFFYMADNRLYMIRNLKDASFSTYGMIVMELNVEPIFEGLKSVWGLESYGVYVDGQLVYTTASAMEPVIPIIYSGKSSYIGKDKKGYYVTSTNLIESNYFTYMIRLDSSTLFAGVNATKYFFAITVLALIPLSIGVFVFLNRMVSRPVDKLVEASREITSGNYGYHIEGDAPGSNEFKYLNDSFNGMSDELKHQFEQIYVEELAIRDANIKALQSQINPHFLNNTLEIINWEARLNGVYKVSNMIEALSTMLNSTLNRKNVQRIPLSEEFEYVDAYMYIISERMGNRLKCIKHVDEELLSLEVPGLIIQPIIENAVEHGMKQAGENTISLDVYTKDSYIYIDVRNSGNMSPADEEKVKALLEDTNSKEKGSVSIGIRNVNNRLKLMFGNDCGLTIVNDGENTLSRLTARRDIAQ